MNSQCVGRERESVVTHLVMMCRRVGVSLCAANIVKGTDKGKLVMNKTFVFLEVSCLGEKKYNKISSILIELQDLL